MPVKDADPEATALDAAFDDAMKAAPRPKEPPPPADTDPDAPFGRNEEGQPNAPHGYTKQGRVRRSPAGRPPNEDRARTAPAEASAEASAPSAPGGPGALDHDYSVPLSEFGDAVWFGVSALGKGGSAIPLIGRYLPERKLAAQALVLSSYKPSLVRAVNLAAQHNERARRFADSIETGDITWALMVGMMIMPFITASAAIWKDSDKTPAMANANLPSVAELAEKNDRKLQAYLDDVSAQLDQLAELAAAAALADMAAQDPQAAEAALAAAVAAGIMPEPAPL